MAPVSLFDRFFETTTEISRQSVTISLGEIALTAEIDSKTYSVNGEQKEFTTAVYEETD